MKGEIQLFMELSKELHGKCVQNKSKFHLSTFNKVYRDDNIKVVMYFGSDYKTWSIYCNGFNFKEYKPSFAIEFNQLNLNFH